MAVSKRTVWQQAKVWYQASRPFTLSAALAPVLVGSSLAFRDGALSWWLFALVLLGSLLVQAAANLVDEYSDHDRPEGNQKLLAPYKVIALGLLSSTAVKRGAIVYFAIATAIGLYLTAVSGWPILALCLGSAAAAYFYSAGPRPLGAIGLGQPIVFLFMGPVMVLGAYYVQTRVFTLEALWLSLPVACTVTAILAANDIRDLEEDRAAKKQTIATWLGRGFANLEWTLLIAAAFLVVLGLALLRITGSAILLALIALPQAVAAVRLVWHGRERAELALALRATARLHGLLGILLALGVSLG